MAAVDPGLDYYAITMTVDRRGHCVIDTQTEFAGWGDIDRRTELRVPSLDKPEAMIYCWQIDEQPYLVVKNEKEWFVYFQMGGNALVEREIARRYLSDRFSAKHCDPSTRITHDQAPFVALKSLPKHAMQRAPTPRLRMDVLDRDKRKCRICGSSPSTNVHVELHVHHIRPWTTGGYTHIENLITLCHTCHKGLDPHEDHSLFDLLPPIDPVGAHAEGVHRYREWLGAQVTELGRNTTSGKKALQPEKE